MNSRLDQLASMWTRLGASFSAPAAAAEPDLEVLLCETARHAPEMSRLFVMAATWLSRYGELAARRRLRATALRLLSRDECAILGLLLELSDQVRGREIFTRLAASFLPAATPRPLFRVFQGNPIRERLALEGASPLSRRWNLWCEEIEPKYDAIRPNLWVLNHNPTLRERAYLRGDMRASVLAALLHDPGAGRSELALARAAGGSRAQVRAALESLEMTGRVRREKGEGRKPTRIELVPEGDRKTVA